MDPVAINGDTLFPQTAVQVAAVGAGDGDRRITDVGAVLADPVDLVEGEGIRAVDTEEFFGGQVRGEVGQGLMAKVIAGGCIYADIVFEAFDIADAFDAYPDEMAIGLEKRLFLFLPDSERLELAWLGRRGLGWRAGRGLPFPSSGGSGRVKKV